MATIRVAQAMDWTEDLLTLLAHAGHDVIADGAAELAFVDPASAEHYDGAAIIVAKLDQVHEAVAKARNGKAHTLVRYPFVADEVTLMVERVLDHVRLAQENQQLRQHRDGDAVAASTAADSISVARNLAGKPLADIEKQVILSTLEQFKGHRVRTATALGIGVRTLGMKLKRWREEGEPIISRSATPRAPMHAST